MPLIDRTASGPNRAPERNEVDPSHGIPYTAASTPSRSVVWGSRANVRGPVNLGDSVASGGSRMVIVLYTPGSVEGSGCTAILSFDVDAESPILAHDRAYAKHAMVMTHQAFGPLVGVPRLLALLADYGLPATFFVPGVTAARYPQTVNAILEAGHEVGHHSHTHVSAVDMTEAQEREDFERALGVLHAQGVEVAGHRAAMWEATWRTAGLVASHGLLYDSSLMDADRPYVLDTGAGEIAE